MAFNPKLIRGSIGKAFKTEKDVLEQTKVVKPGSLTPTASPSAPSGPFNAKPVAGTLGRAGSTAKWAWNNMASSYGGTGWGVAKGMGTHALQGAVVGGLAGGTIEGVQGGSFWTGFKEGAFNGGVGYAGIRGAMAAGGRKNFVKGGFDMFNAQSASPQISKAAQALINQNQRAGYTRMNTVNK